MATYAYNVGNTNNKIVHIHVYFFLLKSILVNKTKSCILKVGINIESVDI